MTEAKGGFKISATVDWIAYNQLGEVIGQGGHKYPDHNQVQKLVTDEIVDALDDDTTFLGDIITMAVGTGTGQDWEQAALSSLVSYETGANLTQSQPTSGALQNVATFTNINNTVTEAGLFQSADGASNMYFYDDTTINQALTPSDTLQVTWTISVVSAS